MNNRKLVLSILGLLMVTILSGQTFEDVLRYSQPQYGGTARSISMGGAFGSLGGDFSSLSINPAGIAAYRSSEFSYTPSIFLNSTQSTIGNIKTDENKTTFALNQIGFVGTYRPMRKVEKGIASTHFAIGYNRNNNFNYKSMAFARDIGYSMAYTFEDNAYGLNPDNYNDQQPQYWDEYNPLTGLAYGAYIIDYEGLDNNNEHYYSSYLYMEDKVDQTMIIEKDGYSGEINITAGANISNFLLIGGSLNFTMLRFKQESTFHESNKEENGTPQDKAFQRYSIIDYLDMQGNGINLKLGVILLPIENLRIGLAYHTPTWYNIEENYGSQIKGLFYNEIVNVRTKDTYAYYDSKYDYNLNTPGKAVASASYVIGKKAIISFDYEYIDYASAKIKSSTGYYNDIVFANTTNSSIKSNLTSTNNLRLGAEYRINKQVSLRGGYAYQDSPYSLSAKSNFNVINSYSAGIGYRNKNYFVDIAYKLTKYDTYYDAEFLNAYYDAHYDNTPKTEINDHNIALTLGWKF